MVSRAALPITPISDEQGGTVVQVEVEMKEKKIVHAWATKVVADHEVFALHTGFS